MTTTLKDVLAQVAALEATGVLAANKIADLQGQIKQLQSSNTKLQALLNAANANNPTQDVLDQAASAASAFNAALAGAIGDPSTLVAIPQTTVDQTVTDLTKANIALGGSIA